MHAKSCLTAILFGSAQALQAQIGFWTPEGSGTTNSLYSVNRQNINEISYAVGASGTVLKKSMTGMWTSRNSGTLDDLRSVFFVNILTGYAVGGLTGGAQRSVILKTVDSGATWQTQNGPVARALRSVHFRNANYGFAAGNGGTILKTINGGMAWTVRNSGTTEDLYSVFFSDTNIGYTVGGDGTILKTTDAGFNWVPQDGATNHQLNSVFFASADTGFIVGNGGVLLFTENGGQTWSTRNPGTSNNLNSVVSFSSIILITGDSGTIIQCRKPRIDGCYGLPIPQSARKETYYHTSCLFTNSSGTSEYAVGSNGTILAARWDTGILPKTPARWRIGKSGELSFWIPFSTRVTARIFDTRGKLALPLFDGMAEAGFHRIPFPEHYSRTPFFLDFQTIPALGHRPIEGFTPP